MVDRDRYPKAKYCLGGPPRLVVSPEEEKQLGEGWFDHPNLVHAAPVVVDAPPRPRGRPKKVVGASVDIEQQ